MAGTIGTPFVCIYFMYGADIQVFSIEVRHVGTLTDLNFVAWENSVALGVITAANVRAVFAADLHRAAADGDGAASSFAAPAYARAAVVAECCHVAFVDGDIAAAAPIAAADARAAVVAGCRHVASVDGDGAAAALIAADACAGCDVIIVAVSLQLAHGTLFLGLGVDGQAVPFAYVDASRGLQFTAVHQNQVDVSFNGDGPLDI